MIYSLGERKVEFHGEDYFVADSDQLIGSVFLKNNASVWFNAVVRGDNDEIIKHGLKNLGVYHPSLPLLKNANGNIITQDLKVLYFYRNRLIGYGLEQHFK